MEVGETVIARAGEASELHVSPRRGRGSVSLACGPWEWARGVSHGGMGSGWG